jgi:(+)-pinoresinol hydroxylase
MKSAATVFMAILGVLAGGTVVAAEQGNFQQGMDVFQKWCAPCHSPGPKHPGTQALDALYKGEKPAALEQRTDLTPEIVSTFVRTGVSIMPPFRKTEIGDADLAALGTYLSHNTQ